MRKLFFVFVLLIHIDDCFSQDCTREQAQATPTILEKGIDNKPFAVKDAYGKKLGDSFFPLFAAPLQQSKGLHGNFVISEANFHVPGLLGYGSSALMYNVYCSKNGGIDWKGLYSLSFKCLSNYFTEDFATEARNELIGVGGDHFIYLDNNLVYILQPRKPGSKINGYPYIEKASSKADDVVLVTRQGTNFFLPVSRKQYLSMFRKTAGLNLDVQKKALAESIKTKAGVEDAIQISINYCMNDLKQIDAFLASHNDDYLNKPCITSHNLESFFGTSFKGDMDYFFDETGVGTEWVVINPKYFNKSLPANAAQFFCVSWGRAEKDAEKKAALLFKQTFDFKKLESLLGN